MRKRLKYLNGILTHYFSRFQHEYLAELRQHHFYVKQFPDKTSITVGDMVLINDDELTSRITWKRGVVDDLIKGKDGKVRGVTLRTYKNGKITYWKRPVRRLVPFEIANQEDTKNLKETVEIVQDKDDKEEVRVVKNPVHNDSIDNHSGVTTSRPKRSAALTADLKRKLPMKHR